MRFLIFIIFLLFLFNRMPKRLCFDCWRILSADGDWRSSVRAYSGMFYLKRILITRLEHVDEFCRKTVGNTVALTRNIEKSGLADEKLAGRSFRNSKRRAQRTFAADSRAY